MATKLPCLGVRSGNNGQYAFGMDLDAALAEVEQLHALLERIRNASLDWALACPHDCEACDAMYDVLREYDAIHEARHPPQPESGSGSNN